MLICIVEVAKVW